MYLPINLLLLLPICLGNFLTHDRFATFYNSDDCNTKEDQPHSLGFSMNDNSCIRQNGRKSFWPGKEGTSGGDYCFVWYVDGDGDCDCIGGSRKIQTRWKNEPGYTTECEIKMVEGHTSFHFEEAKDGKCPTKGCYSQNTVEWEYVLQDSQAPIIDHGPSK